jgi:hypothetical protein
MLVRLLERERSADERGAPPVKEIPVASTFVRLSAALACAAVASAAAATAACRASCRCRKLSRIIVSWAASPPLARSAVICSRILRSARPMLGWCVARPALWCALRALLRAAA